jgi:hypothetical protein
MDKYSADSRFIEGEELIARSQDHGYVETCVPVDAGPGEESNR